MILTRHAHISPIKKLLSYLLCRFLDSLHPHSLFMMLTSNMNNKILILNNKDVLLFFSVAYIK